MSGFSLDDRARSIRRFCVEAFGSPPWRFRVQRQFVADEERPAGIIEPASPVGVGALPGRTTVPQGDLDFAQTFGVILFPSFLDGDGQPVTEAEAAQAAREAAETMNVALATGVVLSDGRRWSWPYRLPLFDFAEVPIIGEGRVGPAEPYGWMWVEEAPVNPIADSTDPLRWSIATNLRVSWRQPGAPDEGGPDFRSMSGTFAP